ncbi:TPA: DUF3265 domain-containing protein [Vibrio vulnificus]|nr:DUF3265 domain-containing protein [Vibrio vulnificus]HDY8220577.1 DUF3265 domain-containing protein [Vibrio vulnificus]
MSSALTRRLRGIRAAWHFLYAVSFDGAGVLRKVGFCGTHPLTRRYVNGAHLENISSQKW